jgi:hypothetical protein
VQSWSQEQRPRPPPKAVGCRPTLKLSLRLPMGLSARSRIARLPSEQSSRTTWPSGSRRSRDRGKHSPPTTTRKRKAIKVVHVPGLQAFPEEDELAPEDAEIHDVSYAARSDEHRTRPRPQDRQYPRRAQLCLSNGLFQQTEAVFKVDRPEDMDEYLTEQCSSRLCLLRSRYP